MAPEAVWASVGVGALFCGVGSALLRWAGPIVTFLDSYRQALAPWPRLARPSRELQVTDSQVRYIGAALVAAGVLLLVVMGVQLGQASQALSGPTNRDFQEIVSQSSSGVSFDVAVAQFLTELRGARGYAIRDASFIAERENPVCDSRLASCAPEPSAAPVREWDGQLVWMEMRANGSWTNQSCEALAIVTRAQGWRIEGSRWCDLLPK
jgi:hypothetical protein